MSAGAPARRVAGWPEAGSIGALLDTPEWVGSAATSASVPLHQPLDWTLFDTDVPLVGVQLIEGPRVAWTVEAGANATTLTVPLAPSTVDEATLFGANARAAVGRGRRRARSSSRSGGRTARRRSSRRRPGARAATSTP